MRTPPPGGDDTPPYRFLLLAAAAGRRFARVFLEAVLAPAFAFRTLGGSEAA